jgi:hypothetical protein
VLATYCVISCKCENLALIVELRIHALLHTFLSQTFLLRMQALTNDMKTVEWFRDSLLPHNRASGLPCVRSKCWLRIV